MPFPIGWPPRPPAGRRTFRFYAGGTATANFADNAFLFHQVNSAYALIGAGLNGRVLVYTTATGQVANDFSIEVLRPTSGPSALSAAFVAGSTTAIQVSLATNATGQLVPASNTATLVAAAVNALVGVTAVALGTGADSLSKAERVQQFFGGGLLMDPTPVVSSGGASVTAFAGRSSVPGGPFAGANDSVDALVYPYGRPEPMLWASTILVQNDDTTATNTIEYSFDGINVHGEVLGGETQTLRNQYEAGISVRFTAGTPAFRITAW